MSLHTENILPKKTLQEAGVQTEWVWLTVNLPKQAN